jgi:hypothetical protein
MALTYEDVAKLDKTSDYIKALKSNRSFVNNLGKFLLVVINYQGKLDKKTTIILPFKTEALALKEFKMLKEKAKKDIKKNQVALGTYSYDKETNTTNFEITKGQAGPKKVNKKTPKLYKAVFGSLFVASLSAEYDGEGEILDDADDLDDDDDLTSDGEQEIVEAESEAEVEDESSKAAEVKAVLDPQISVLATGINKGIKSLIEKTAANTKAVVGALVSDIPKFLQLAEAAGVKLPKVIADFLPIAKSYLAKLTKPQAEAAQEKPSVSEKLAEKPAEKVAEKPAEKLSENQVRARQLNKDILALAKQIQALEAKKK